MAHRREQKERLRREREERERAAREAAERKRRLGYVAGGALAAAALAVLVLLVASGAGGGDGGSGSFPSGSVPQQRELGLEAAAQAADCSVRRFKSEGAQHVEGQVSYSSNPPHSGNNNQVPADDGAYADPIADENLVHALEHGRVIYWFDPGAPARPKGDLKTLFDEDDYHLLLAPAERRMPYQVAATAWTRVLGCEDLGERTFDALRAFRDEFRDQGPENVP